MPAQYQAFQQELKQFIASDRIFEDEFHRLTYGTDASFYRLIPKLVVKTINEQEVVKLIALARQYAIALTFRAAGTSLSGQAVTDSVLVVLEGNSWRQYQISDDGAEIMLQPGIIGMQANQYLSAYGRKIGPDPASIATAKIGGIAANNASGMCCGTAQNSYHTLVGMRVVLADGGVLDTRSESDRATFQQTHSALLEQVRQLSAEVKANAELSQLIKHKFRLKNTTGYSLNALVDFDDPLEVIQHLMIGSEGTLGFISEINYHTVLDLPNKATALVLFPNIEAACVAVAALKSEPVDAVELIDGAGLRSVQDKPGMPPILQTLDQEAAALLIDVRAESETKLNEKITHLLDVLAQQDCLQDATFTHDAEEYVQLWNVRKGLFPAVGAVRPLSTTVIIEDVAFPVPQLAAGTRELQALFAKYHYDEAIIFGHALEGNLHFVFTQDFSTSEEVERYAGFMQDVSELVAVKYGGSLKAEHGTGRNMAPFVEMEWGTEAYQLMWRIKRLFDPENILNPGVVLNEDKDVHLKNLKPMPAANALVDRCIECGFCEPVCPSRNLTLTPRQRIVAWREHARLSTQGLQQEAQQWEQLFSYDGLETCALDGLCATRCPVGINTGELVRELMGEQRSESSEKWGMRAQTNIAPITAITRTSLGIVAGSAKLLGVERQQAASQKVTQWSKGKVPQWHAYMPRAAKRAQRELPHSERKVVYFPSCVSRSLGTAVTDDETRDLQQVIYSLLQKAGFEAIHLLDVDKQCCGLPFASKAIPGAANTANNQLEQALWEASEQGKYPVLCDTSPCSLRMLESFTKPMKVYETAGFIHEHLLPYLKIDQQTSSVALHTTCSARKMGLQGVLRELVGLCVSEVIEAEEEGCCGFGGDKGFLTPELNAAALARLQRQLPDTCKEGYSNSRTCEIGLSLHTGRQYRSVAYLVDACT